MINSQALRRMAACKSLISYLSGQMDYEAYVQDALWAVRDDMQAIYPELSSQAQHDLATQAIDSLAVSHKLIRIDNSDSIRLANQ